MNYWQKKVQILLFVNAENNFLFCVFYFQFDTNATAVIMTRTSTKVLFPNFSQQKCNFPFMNSSEFPLVIIQTEQRKYDDLLQGNQMVESRY